MAKGIDFSVSKNELGLYDIAFTEEGDIKGTSSFDTAILMTALCERRAEASEVPNNAMRRGWWGNTLNENSDFEIGSKAWLLGQSRKTNVELNLALTYYRTAFQWLIDDGYAETIEVIGELTGSGILVYVTINVSSSNVDVPFFDLWLGTGVNVQVTVQ